MKYILILFITTLFTLTASAQKQTYLLVAYCQKKINGICGEKMMILQEEVSLLPAETITYRSKLLTEIRATYNKGYENLFVQLEPAGKAVIVYEYEKTFTPQSDGWDCTTTSYGIVRGNDMLAAEKAYAALQAQYKRSTYKEVRRWGKPANLTPAAPGENDVSVKWSTASNAYLLKMTNTRKDVALKITIISYKRKAGAEVPAGAETDLSKMTKSEETTVILEPVTTSQKQLSKADGFEIRISPKAATEEEQGVVDKIKQIMKNYITDPKKSSQPKEVSPSAAGSRG